MFRRNLLFPFLTRSILKMVAADCSDTETNLYHTKPRTVNLTIISLLLAQNKPGERTTAIRFTTDWKCLFHHRNVIRTSLLRKGSGVSLPQYSSSNVNLTTYLRLVQKSRMRGIWLLALRTLAEWCLGTWKTLQFTHTYENVNDSEKSLNEIHWSQIDILIAVNPFDTWSSRKSYTKENRFLSHRKSFILFYEIHRLMLYRETCMKYVTRTLTVRTNCRPFKYLKWLQAF